jgi:hypothetical protein
MRTCKKCGVKVRGAETVCPLCQHRLSGEPEEAVYPQIPTVYKQHEMFFKCLILSSVAAGVVCVAVNLLLPAGGFWSVFVVLGILCFWVSLAYAVRKKDNIPKNITGQVFLVSVLSFGWDWLTGWRGWSLNFVIPIACSVALLSLAIVAKVMRMPPGDYIAYFTIDIVFGIVPLVFYLTGLISIATPSVVCISLSILSLSALLVFEGKNMLQEMAKRFHV